jgi:hypothetical protein
MLPQLDELYVNGLMNTEDANEGINSFLEKENQFGRIVRFN